MSLICYRKLHYLITIITIIALILFVHITYNPTLEDSLRSGSLIILNKSIQDVSHLKIRLENSSLSLMTCDPSAAKKPLVSSIYKNVYINNSTKLCKNGGYLLKLLIIIHSAPSNYKNRSVIRQTWGSYGNRSDIDIGFILGQSLDQSIENSLFEENNLYDDIIRGQFIDAYDNLTLKSISMLEWVDKKCSHASYILKSDDDMFINIPNLLQFINQHQNNKYVIYGCLDRKIPTIRDNKSIRYTKYVKGGGYLMPSLIIHELYITSLKNTYLEIEDLFLTGIVAKQLHIKRLHDFRFMNLYVEIDTCIIRKAITILLVKLEQQFEAWTKFLDTTTKCN